MKTTPVMNQGSPPELIFWKFAINKIIPIRDKKPILLFNIAWMEIGLLPEELMYFVLETNSPMLRPVHIGKTSQFTVIISKEAIHPSVRSESAPVEIILRRPIATPKFHPKLINQPMYLGILPANSYPSGRPVGRIFAGFSFTFSALLALEGLAVFFAFGLALATAFAAFGLALATAFAAFGLAFAGSASSKLSTLSSKPIISTLTIHSAYCAINLKVITLCKF